LDEPPRQRMDNQSTSHSKTELSSLRAGDQFWRVKVYKLEEENWVDQGTGHLDSPNPDKPEKWGLVVYSEDNGLPLLRTRISADIDYNHQQGSLIVWNEPLSGNPDGIDVALSFQYPEACKVAYEKIKEIQKKLGQKQETNLVDFDELVESGSQEVDDLFELSDATAVVELPPPNLKHLDQIIQLLNTTVTPLSKERLALTIIKEGYLKKLVDLFHTVEELESLPELHKLFEIFKRLVMLNSSNLLQQIFSKEYVFDVMGALEYDPEAKQKLNHREYLKQHVKFKEVIPFNNPELVERIHQTFRMQYMKDVVLPRCLDELTFATINSLIYVNNVEIVSKIMADKKFLSRLFVKMRAPTTTAEEMMDLIRFTQELCELAKNLEQKDKSEVYQTLDNKGLFHVLYRTLSMENPKLRMISVEILLMVVEFDPSLLRAFILSQAPKYELLKHLIHLYDNDHESGLQQLMTDVFRHLLDLTPKRDEKPSQVQQKGEFVTLFYADFAKILFEPLLRKLPPSGTHTEAEGLVKYNLLELLSHFVVNHGFRVKYFLLNSPLLKKILKLLKCKDKYLGLAVLRFFRAIVSSKDQFYHRHIVKEDLLRPIVETFFENEKYNLVNSAIIGLFEQIKAENSKQLIVYFVETYYPRFSKVDYVRTFRELKEQYEQLQAPEQPTEPPTPSLSTSGLRAAFRNDEDENYFREDDDGEEERTKTPPLVDYPEDADESKESAPATKASSSPHSDKSKGTDINTKEQIPTAIRKTESSYVEEKTMSRTRSKEETEEKEKEKETSLLKQSTNSSLPLVNDKNGNDTPTARLKQSSLSTATADTETKTETESLTNSLRTKSKNQYQGNDESEYKKKGQGKDLSYSKKKDSEHSTKESPSSPPSSSSSSSTSPHSSPPQSPSAITSLSPNSEQIVLSLTKPKRHHSPPGTNVFGNDDEERPAKRVRYEKWSL